MGREMLLINVDTVYEIVNDFTDTEIPKEAIIESLKSRDIITKENKQSCDRLVDDTYGDVDDH